MKKIIFVLFALFTTISFAQERIGFLSRTSFGIYGGLSFRSVNKGWGAFLFEGKTHLSEKYLIKLSFGYSELQSYQKYNVKSYTSIYNENVESVDAISYNIDRIDYKIIPLSIGLQYNINFSSFHPYIFAELGYNFIDPLSTKSEFKVLNTYQKYSDLPLVHRYIHRLATNSSKIAIGFGVNYPLSSVFGLDIRFLTQIDTEILNSQQLLVGLTF
ncbi:MAG: hypothetical protein H6610_03720 [Ignavibacteriales bacterium]|nr:hypothetical protein [Ignavibacteriales bacterium]MCB9210058.1 hypothetical protein [Ignavibacteriales bacterium]MCB9218557.1 hypothetical protein [Ignavibacteriales bacterium]MCB9259437.1 hypothetical protein [Ignavibacteriales bacterium]